MRVKSTPSLVCVYVFNFKESLHYNYIDIENNKYSFVVTTLFSYFLIQETSTIMFFIF
jgi:hypothetical protein